MLELLTYLSVRAAFAFFGVFPHRWRVVFFASLWRVAFVLVPRLRRTADINLKIAFPDRDSAWRRAMIRKNAVEMGRLIADTIRLSSLNEHWVRQHIEIPAIERYGEVASKQGILIATGHLGSFELLGHAIGLYGYPLAAVARRFKSARLDRWWAGMREARGNQIIDRTGAFKEMVRAISSGTSVAVLFDQNVKINHAVFVDWFGKPAATTRAFALAAIKTEAPVFVAAMVYLGADRYRVESVECDLSALYRDTAMSDGDKVEWITKVISKHYCDMIKSFPEGWFWIHRRWKTRPEGDTGLVYF
jgi:KDO2-lipid IV(A) lauroyltransferase